MGQEMYPWPSDDGPEESKPAPADAKKRRRGRELRIRINADHTIDVLHATDMVPLEACAVTLDDTATGPVWIQLGKSGSYLGHPSGPFRLDEAVFAEIVRNFHASENKRIPIDFEHASEHAPTDGSVPTAGAPAQGWITDLKIEGTNLYGLAEWLEPAKTYIRNGNYRFISPAIRFKSRDRVTNAAIGARLTSAGLTNTPFLDGMMPMAAKDVDCDAVGRALTEAVRAQEGLDPPSQDEAVAGAPAGEREATMLTGEQKLLSDLQTLNAQLTLTCTESKARITVLETENTEFKKRLTERDEADLIKEVDDAFDTHKDARKLTDKEKPLMLRLARGDRSAFQEMYPPVPIHQRHLLRVVATPRDREPDPPTTMADPDNTKVDFSALVAEFQKNGKTLSEAVALATDKAWPDAHKQRRTAR